MRRRKEKLLSLLVSLSMFVGMIQPMMVSAAEGGAALKNAEVYQVFPTHFQDKASNKNNDGTLKHIGGQVTHPDIVKVDGGWNGYEYWVVYTPNVSITSQYENPYIAASNDGVHWVEPEGIKNPIEPEPISLRYHNCDADMIYNREMNAMMAYWNWADDQGGGVGAEVRVRISYDGVHWGVPGTYDEETGIWRKPENEQERTLKAPTTDANGLDNSFITVIASKDRYDMLSPTFTYDENRDIFVMWANNTKDVGYNNGQRNYVETRWSKDGLTWSKPKKVNNFLAQTASGASLAPWHQDINYIPELKEYWALSQCFTGGNPDGSMLYLTTSKDGINWKQVGKDPILSPGEAGKWDSFQIYRSTFLFEDDVFKVWYSALQDHTANKKVIDENGELTLTAGPDDSRIWRIGYTENGYIDMMKVLTGDEDFAKPELVEGESLTITADKTELEEGKEAQITVGFIPENTSDQIVTYVSSNEDVLTVSPFGVVTAVKAGTAVVSASAKDGIEDRVEFVVTKRQTATSDTYLSDIEWLEQTCGAPSDFPNGTAKDTNIAGDAIVLKVDGHERTFDKGLGIHAPSSVTYDIAGKGYTNFEAYAGVDYSQAGSYPGEAVIGNFIVKIDGEMVAESGEMNPTMDAHYFNVEIPKDAQELTLETEIGPYQDWSDWGDWADARLIADLGEPENLALNKSVTVKKSTDGSDANINPDRPAAMAVDGVKNDTNRNYCDFGTDNNRQSIYLQVDLGSVDLISQINLWRYWGDGRTYNATVIAVSENEDFSNPIVVYNSDKNNVHGFGAGSDELYAESAEGKHIESDKLVKGQFVRVYTYGVNGTATTNHIVELEVMGYHVEQPVKPEGPTIDPVEGNNIRLHVEKGQLNLYRGDTLIASSVSLGKVTAGGRTYSDFDIVDYEMIESVETERGEARRLVLDMYSEKGKIAKTVWYDLLKDIDGAIFTTTFLEAEANITVAEVTENQFCLAEPDASRIWSYNGGGEGSQSWYDTLQKVNNSFYRENKQDDTSAAIPAADIYSVNGGITVGDGALYRRFLTTPVKGGNDSAAVAINWKNYELSAGEEKEVGTSIIGVHSGDYYNGLRTYANVMKAQGFSTPNYVPETSYDLRWESWGWEGAWTIDKILGKLDDLYAQGIRQITLDDCWYTSAGDWELNPEKFPKGVEDMRRLTDAVHEKGMTIAIWWRPMDGGRDRAFSVLAGFTQQPSQLLEEHPEYFVKNEDGSFAKLAGPGGSGNFNGSTGYALCPYSEGAIESQKDFIRRAMTEWGIDGFKSDYVWGMPKCYNEAHNHERPEESTEMASNIFYKALYEEMISINPDAFHLLCNCGTPQDYYSLPYVTQIPTADPTSVDQTRRRVKAYKALAGDDFPVTTDHNEIWYPSSVGTGAVLIEKRDFVKGSAQEQEYYKWLNIADEHQLHKGTHVGDLYSYGIDPYETYVIRKDNMMYYSFYCDGNKYRPQGHPEVTLKGLDPEKTYRIEDYINDVVIAEEVLGADATFNVAFDKYLLVRAIVVGEEPEPSEADKTDLLELLKYANDQKADTANYQWVVQTVKNVFEDALKKAQEVYDEPSSTQAQVDAAYDVLLSRVHLLGFVGNTTDLKTAVESAKGVSTEGKTEESAEVLKNAIAKAEKMLKEANTLQEDLDAMIIELQNAIAGLEDKVVIEVNKTKLLELIEKAKGYDLTKYTKVTADALEAAITGAQGVYDDLEAVQDQADSAYKSLRQAIFNLRKIPNKDELQNLVNSVKAMDLGVYTAKTASAVKAAYANAVAVLNDDNATEDEVKAAVAALNTAVDKLAEKPGEDKAATGEKDKADGKKVAGTDSKDTGKTTTAKSAAKTADTMPAATSMMLLAVSATGILLVMKKRREMK